MKQQAVQFDMYTYIGPRRHFFRAEEVHRPFVMIAMESGTFEYTIGPEKGRATFGDLVLVPPKTLFKRRALSEITFHMLCFTLPADEKANSETFPIGKTTIRDVKRLSSDYTYLRTAWRKYGSQTKDSAVALHMLNDLLLLGSIEKNHLEHEKRSMHIDSLMDQAREYIHEHLFQGVRMKEISNHLGLVPSDFTRRFRLAFGTTPIEYVTRLRLEQVKKLLLETDETLDTIAGLCGYENGVYLSRVFRAKTGLNASDFRSSHRI